MYETELRARFDKEISAPHKELLWRWLEQRDYVRDVCRGALGWEDFKAEAHLLANHQREMLGRPKPYGRTQRHDLFTDEVVELTDLEAEHAAALAPYLAKRAALLPEVRGFREEKLGGGTLEPEQVVASLRSELGRLPLQEYADLEWALEEAPPDAVDEEEELKDLVGGWVYRSGASQLRYSDEAFRKGLELDSMKIPIAPEHPYLYGLMHLVRDETGRTLEDVSRWLISRYPWLLRDAAWFMLTGEAPEINPLRIERNSASGAYQVTFASWISEKTIRLAYRSLQRRDNRPLGNKGLAAFRFVGEHTEPGQTPKWADLTRRWNKEHPDNMFTDRSALRRAYERAEKRLASPWVNEQGHTAEKQETDIVEPNALF